MRILSAAATCLLLAISSSTTTFAEETANNKTPLNTQPEQWQNDLVQWLISKPGGYFSDKVIWTKSEMGYNMHAAEDIAKDDTLMIIPQGALINSDGTEEECVTINKMMLEYEKGEASEYYPYMRYLFGGHEGGTSTGLLPTTWSHPAKHLLKMIVGDSLQPQRVEKRQSKILQDCRNEIDAKLLEEMTEEKHVRWKDAYIFWLSRSWSDKMVPILDMINHRNGKWLNVESTTAHSGEPIKVYALRDIKKGEQLWNTYNECLDEDCDGGRIKYTYITPHILMDYGFVEAYPRRFMFEVDSHGGKRFGNEFLIVEIDEDADTGKVALEWHYNTPSEAQLEWISRELKRLEAMEDRVKSGLAEVTSEHEKYTLETFYNAYKEAFELSLHHKEDDVSTRTTTWEEEEVDEEDDDDDEEGEEL